MRTSSMRSLLLVAWLASSTHADPPAKARIDITHEQRFESRDKPIVVKIDGRTHRLALDQSVAIDLAVGSVGRAVPIEVSIAGRRAIKRWGVLVPGGSYRVRENPCSHWDLGTPASADVEDTYRIDARALPAKLFPLEFNGEKLEQPGVSSYFEVPKSAMCLRAGASIKVTSGKRVLFEEDVIGHPGRAHTITLKPGGFTIALDP